MYTFGIGHLCNSQVIFTESQTCQTIEEATLLLPTGVSSLSLEEIQKELQEKQYSRIACTTVEEWFLVTH